MASCAPVRVRATCVLGSDALKETREKFWAPGPRGYCRLLVRVDDKQVPCPAVRYLLI